MPAVDGIFVEVEFVPGTPVDVTQWVDQSAAIRTQFGRGTPFEKPKVATLDLTLFNDDGRFSPLRQTLNDGSVHPYWPNVVPRRLVRYGWKVGATRYVRFTGYVRGWSPEFKDGVRPRLSLHADDQSVMVVASKAKLRPVYEQEVATDNPDRWWRLDGSQPDDAVTKFALDSATNSAGGVLVSVNADSTARIKLGQSGPTSEDGTVALFTRVSTTDGEYLRGNYTTAQVAAPTITAVTVECVVYPNSFTLAEWPVWITAFGPTLLLTVTTAGAATFGVGSGSTGAGGSLQAQSWTHLAGTWTSSGQLRLFVDGVLVASGTTSTTGGQVFDQMAIGGDARMDGRIGHVAVYHRVLPTTRIAAHAAAMRSWVGETVNQRISRFLLAGGVTAGNMQIDTSSVVLGPSPQAGSDPIAAAQDLCESEGNAAALYTQPDGKLRFFNRNARKSSTAPALTLDAAADVEGTDWSPAYDTDTLCNEADVTYVPAGTTDTFTLSLVSQASIDMFGRVADDVRTYELPDGQGRNVRAIGQARIAGSAYPSMRLGRVTTDLFTSVNVTAAAAAAAALSARLRVSGLPGNAGMPASSVDLYVEGWQETAAAGMLQLAFDTSAADQPAELVWGDDTFGRWQANGQTLATSETASDTAIAIASPAGGSTFTTDPAMYPLTIIVGSERIRLNNPPSGASSPQTFTGVTRGADGSGAAAQSAGAAVDLYPTSTWAL